MIHRLKQKKSSRKNSSTFLIYGLVSFFSDLPIAIYEQELLDLISRKLKTCKICLPQTNGQRDREIKI